MSDERPHNDDVGNVDASGQVGSTGRTAAGVLVVLLAVVVALGLQGALPHWVTGSEHTETSVVPLPLPPMDPVAIARKVEPELVNINVSIEPTGMGAAGSGIVLSADGQVLTSHHVVKGANVITVGDVGTGAQFPATVLGYDSTDDIALLSLNGAGGLPSVRLGNSSTLRPGDQIMAIGNAGGTGHPTAEPGTVTSLNTSIVARDAADLSRKALTGMLELDAPVASGQSGGAVVDRSGAVVGVVTAASGELTKTDGRATGYAVPIDRAMQIVRQIRSGTPTDTVHIGPTATLGVLTSDAATGGARVDVSIYGLPAYAAGLTAGEVITAIDGHPVSSAKTLKYVLNVRKPADTVRLDLIEPDGSRREVAVVLASGPPN
ncbi:S1C family serine protease [Nocardia miyunensis]|uniref:S1C family serine protease n=1 Tax=Nocardia miyunensis TaxID=282684 RepID=UPI000835DA6D|nr:trypsin-like peptidase domain-containing protein [Nocardia miyunensis]